MKKILFLLFIASGIITAQFKDSDDQTVNIKDGITNYQPSSLFLNFFNPQNFSMRHSVSMSYSAMGNQGVALGTYTNSMAYQFSEDFNIEVDASIVTSPYSSFGKEHQDAINGIYLSRAQLNYRFSDNMSIMVRYLNYPPGSYYPNNYYGFQRLGTSLWDRQ